MARSSLLPCLLCASCLLFAGCAGLSGMGGLRRGSGEGVVRAFVRDFGHRVGPVVGLFADDATVELAGLGVLLHGKSGVEELAEYAVATGSQLRLTGSEQHVDTVRCWLEESNDWLRLLAISEVRYEGEFVLSGGRVRTAVIKLEPESRERLGAELAEFVVWLSSREPGALDELLPGGNPRYTADSARQLLRLLRLWRSESP